MVFVPKRRRGRLDQGDRVRVAGHVGGTVDDDGNATFELHGERGRVVGNPYKHADTGEKMVGVQLDNGAVAAVPRRALRGE